MTEKMTTTVRELRERYEVAVAVQDEMEALLVTRDHDTKDVATERYMEAAEDANKAFVAYWTAKSAQPRPTVLP